MHSRQPNPRVAASCCLEALNNNCKSVGDLIGCLNAMDLTYISDLTNDVDQALRNLQSAVSGLEMMKRRMNGEEVQDTSSSEPTAIASNLQDVTGPTFTKARCFAFSPKTSNGTVVFALDQDTGVYEWNLHTMEYKVVIEAQGLRNIALSLDGKAIAVSGDNGVHIYNAETYAFEASPRSDSSDGVAWYSNQKLLYTISQKLFYYNYETNSTERIETLKLSAYQIAIHDEDLYIVDRDANWIHSMDVMTLVPRWYKTVPNLWCVFPIPGINCLIATQSNSGVSLVGMGDGTLVPVTGEFPNAIYALPYPETMYSSKIRFLYTNMDFATAKSFEIQTTYSPSPAAPNPYPISMEEYKSISDGQSIADPGVPVYIDEHSIVVVDKSSCELVILSSINDGEVTKTSLGSLGESIRDVTASLRYIYAAGQYGITAYSIDTKSQYKVVKVEPESTGVQGVTYSDSTRQVYVVSDSPKLIYILNADTLESVGNVAYPASVDPSSIAHIRGSVFALGDYSNKSIHLFDIETRAVYWTASIAINPRYVYYDSLQYLIFATYSGNPAQVINLEGKVYNLNAVGQNIMDSMSISPDGSQYVITRQNSVCLARLRIKLDAPRQLPIPRMTFTATTEGVRPPVTSSQFQWPLQVCQLPDGQNIVVGEGEGTSVRIINRETQECKVLVDVPRGNPQSVCYVAGTKEVVVCGDGGCWFVSLEGTITHELYDGNTPCVAVCTKTDSKDHVIVLQKDNNVNLINAQTRNKEASVYISQPDASAIVYGGNNNVVTAHYSPGTLQCTGLFSESIMWFVEAKSACSLAVLDPYPGKYNYVACAGIGQPVKVFSMVDGSEVSSGLEGVRNSVRVGVVEKEGEGGGSDDSNYELLSVIPDGDRNIVTYKLTCGLAKMD